MVSPRTNLTESFASRPSRLERIPEAWLVFPEDGGGHQSRSPAIPVNLRNAIGSRLQVRCPDTSIITSFTVFLYLLITTFKRMLVLGVVVLV